MCQGSKFSDVWNDSILKSLSDQIIQCFIWSKNEYHQNWKSLVEHLFSYSLVTISFRFVPHFQLCVGTLHTCRMTSGMEHWDLNFNRLSVKLKRNASAWSKPAENHWGVSRRVSSNPRSYPVRVVMSVAKVATPCSLPEMMHVVVQKWVLVFMLSQTIFLGLWPQCDLLNAHSNALFFCI